MEFEQILKIVSIVLGALCSTIIPTAIALAKAVKAKRQAKSEAERQAADNAMLQEVNNLIASAEALYKAVDTSLKSQGQTAGPLKKKTVMADLQSYALKHGYVFDEEYWSGKIDEIVQLTRDVNAKK